MTRAIAVQFHKDGIGPKELKASILLEGHLSDAVILGYEIAASLVGSGRYPHGYPWYFSDVQYTPDKEKDDHSRLRLIVTAK